MKNNMEQLKSLAEKMIDSAEEDGDVRTIRNRVIIHLILSKIMEAQVTQRNMEALNRRAFGFNMEFSLDDIINEAARLTPEEILDALKVSDLVPVKYLRRDGDERFLDVIDRRYKKFSDVEKDYFSNDFEPMTPPFVWKIRSKDFDFILGNLEGRLKDAFGRLEVTVDWYVDIHAVKDTDHTCKTVLYPTLQVTVDHDPYIKERV